MKLDYYTFLVKLTKSARGSSLSNVGGRTTTGSGPHPAYSGRSYYGGGASVPYKAGSPSTSGISPFRLGAGVAGLTFWPGNETRSVICRYDPYLPYACDDNTNSTYMLDLIGNGSYAGRNKSIITLANVNETETILINGTLPNGTTAAGSTKYPNAGASLRTILYDVG
ncbi:hypothetical protein V8F33_014210 [Rhypophila sp. PSN 637]